MDPRLEPLVSKNDSKLILLVADGLGGIGTKADRRTELEVASTPNLDQLAKESSTGLLDPVGPGITPGSGAAHFALFGYNPIDNLIGRGVLEAAGIGVPMTDQSIAVRINFCTLDQHGHIIDRRAGRLSSEDGQRICRLLGQRVTSIKGFRTQFFPVKEHRAVLLIEGADLGDAVNDTDPQKMGVPPILPEGHDSRSAKTAAILIEVIHQATALLRDEPRANGLLLRGISAHRSYRSFQERYALNSYAIASYPMYRGIASLVGMTIAPHTDDLEAEFKQLRAAYRDYDFFFVHYKQTDAAGEDGDFSAKVSAIERLDRLLPMVTDLHPDVLAITGDHSTPSRMKQHSWHPVPVLLNAETARIDAVTAFNEQACLSGALGRFRAEDLMALMLAHAGRISKFGA